MVTPKPPPRHVHDVIRSTILSSSRDENDMAAARRAKRSEQRGDGLDLKTLQEETDKEELHLRREWQFTLPSVRSL